MGGALLHHHQSAVDHMAVRDTNKIKARRAQYKEEA
jgi:hypothetical protein